MRYRKAEEFKETGFEWISKIPKKWDCAPLKWFLKTMNGYAFSSEDYLDKNVENGVPIIRIGDIQNGEIDLSDLRRLPYSFLNEYKDYQLLKNDLLIAMSGATVGKVGRYNLNEKGLLNQRVGCLRPKKRIIPEYLWYVVNSDQFENYIKFYAWGGAQPNISDSVIINFPGSLPPNKEQRSIVTFLDRKTETINLLVQKKEQLIERLKEKRQALITQAVTKGLDQNVPMKDSGVNGLGQVPAHWNFKALKFATKINDETLTEDENADKKIHYIDIGNVTATGKVLNIEDYKFDNAPSRARRVIKSGDTIISTVRTYLEAVAYFDKIDKELICSTGFAVLSPTDEYLSKYIYYWVSSKFFIDRVVANSVGVSYPAINFSDLGSLPIPIISKSEQQKIVNHIESKNEVLKSITKKIESEIEKLKEYRQSLISAAVTGKIDVRATEVHAKTQEPRKEISGWDKFVLAMEIVKRMQDNQHFGRIMLVKILFLIEYHLRIKGFNSNYERWDHGPFDNQLINSVEYNLKKDGWIDIELEESKNYDQKVYTPTQKAYEKSHYFKNSWGELDGEIEQILSIFNDANSTQAEIIATVYAAYNDLLIEGKEPSEDKVLDEILNNWHPNKKKISEERWRSAYRWIKEKGLVPTGFGKSTKEAA